MTQKSSSNKGKKYPKIVSQNKALCKAVSILPVNRKISVPMIYVRSLPMILGVVSLFILLILPSSRNVFFEKTLILKNQMALSLETGLDAYVYQIKHNIKILPIDSQLESKNYLGRSEVPNLKQLKYESFSERAHFMTATISQGFKTLK